MMPAPCAAVADTQECAYRRAAAVPGMCCSSSSSPESSQPTAPVSAAMAIPGGVSAAPDEMAAAAHAAATHAVAHAAAAAANAAAAAAADTVSGGWQARISSSMQALPGRVVARPAGKAGAGGPVRGDADDGGQVRSMHSSAAPCKHTPRTCAIHSSWRTCACTTAEPAARCRCSLCRGGQHLVAGTRVWLRAAAAC